MTRGIAVLGAIAGAALLSSAVVLAQDAKQIEAGKKLYDQQKCATCHVIAGKGGTMTKLYPLDGVGSKTPEADIRKWMTAPAEMEAKLTKKPTLKMSSKKYDLKEADVDALVAYMLSLKSK
jgi:mono/diheme cytochrome c family protein